MDMSIIAILYAGKIVNEDINRKTGEPYVFADVPARMKQQVADILINDCDLPELVPVEFGGTAE